MSTPFRLLLPRPIYEALLEQARTELPNECCGLLGGRIEGGVGRVVRHYPLVNRLASPREYLAEDRSLLDATKAIREARLEEVAVYHSHPTTEPVPSRTDLERNLWPGVVHIIIGPRASPPVRAWWLEADGYREAECEVTEGPG